MRLEEEASCSNWQNHNTLR